MIRCSLHDSTDAVSVHGPPVPSNSRAVLLRLSPHCGNAELMLNIRPASVIWYMGFAGSPRPFLLPPGSTSVRFATGVWLSLPSPR